jgi:hypothetical protein
MLIHMLHYGADVFSQRTRHKHKRRTSHVRVGRVSPRLEHVSSRHVANGMSSFAVGPTQTLRN